MMTRPRIWTLALSLTLFLASGCEGCQRGDQGQPWDVEDRTDSLSSDTHSVEDIRDTAPDTTPDATPLDTDHDTIDTNDSADATPLTCLQGDGSACPIQQADAWGDCRMSMGVIFDGERCVPVSGCGCEGDDCPAFDELTECALSCAGSGECTSEDLPLTSYGRRSLECGDTYCGYQLDVCVDADDDPTSWLSRVNPRLDIGCRRDFGERCHLFPPESSGDCDEGEWCCSARAVPVDLTDADLRGMCAMHLLRGVERASCFSLE